MVIAFFFGNGVPCLVARQFYHAYNGRKSLYICINEEFHDRYRTRQQSSSDYKPHVAEYYNMHWGKYLYINGSCLNQFEPVLYRADMPVKFGIENTGFPHLLWSMLKHVRQLNVL